MRVLVLGGGPSAEHEVSLRTAQMVFDNLDNAFYEPHLATITKEGKWLMPPFWPMDEAEAVSKLKDVADVVFLALHGEYGEDGHIQRILDLQRIPYTGSGTRASVWGMNKSLSRDRFRAAGLPVPRTFGFFYDTYQRAKDEILHILSIYFTFPIVAKPADRGSSVGVSVAHSLPHLEQSILNVFHYSPFALAEEYVWGIELACGVYENKAQVLVPLLPTEIIPQSNSFFDYNSKYSEGGAFEITPARIPDYVSFRAQDLALRAHTILGCKGYSRTDMIWDQSRGKIYLLEVNTLPGLTKESIFPKAAAAMGISFQELLDAIVNSAFTK